MASLSNRTFGGSRAKKSIIPRESGAQQAGSPFVMTASRPIISRPSAVGDGSMAPSRMSSPDIWNHVIPLFGELFTVNEPRQPATSGRVHRGDCSPRKQFNRPLSVASGQRLQALPAVVVFASLYPSRRQKQRQAHGEIRVRALHLKALSQSVTS
jgi:hypothetical protein